MSSPAAAAPALERPRLPAPLWHTGLVLLYVLVPHNWWPGWTGLLRILPYNSGAFELLGMALYTAAVALVCFGLSWNQTPLEELLGNLWTSWRGVLRDVAIGIGFWLVVRYADRLLYYLASSPGDRTRRLIPHTKGELLISILFAVAAGIAEELIFRGYLQKQFTVLCRSLGAALLIQAALFALYHGYRQSLASFGQHFLFALMAGLLAHWRKSLLPGMIGHAWLDAYWSVVRLVRIT